MRSKEISKPSEKNTSVRLSLIRIPERKRSGPRVFWVAHPIPHMARTRGIWNLLAWTFNKSELMELSIFSGLKTYFIKITTLGLGIKKLFLSAKQIWELWSGLHPAFFARWVYPRGQTCVSSQPLGATMALPKPGVCRPQWFFCLRRHSRDLYLEDCVQHFQGSVSLWREPEAWTKICPHTRVFSSIAVVLLLRFLSYKVEWAWGVCPGKKPGQKTVLKVKTPPTCQ